MKQTFHILMRLEVTLKPGDKPVTEARVKRLIKQIYDEVENCAPFDANVVVSDVIETTRKKSAK